MLSRSSSPLSILVPIALWSMLFLGIGAGNPRSILHSGNLFELFQGLRSLFPFIAAGLAIGFIGIRVSHGFFPKIGLSSPLGLATIYGAIGIFSAFNSPDGSVAIWWSLLYLTAPIFLLSILYTTNPLAQARRLINVTWFLAILAVATLISIATIYLNFSETFLNPARILDCQEAPWFDLTSGRIRSTGVGRYAAISGLLAISGLWMPRWKWAWFVVLLASVILLFFSGARGSIIGFGVGSSVMILAYLATYGYRAILAGILSAIVAISILWSTGIIDTIIDNCIVRGRVTSTQSVPSSLASSNNLVAPSNNTSDSSQNNYAIPSSSESSPNTIHQATSPKTSSSGSDANQSSRDSNPDNTSLVPTVLPTAAQSSKNNPPSSNSDHSTPSPNPKAPLLKPTAIPTNSQARENPDSANTGTDSKASAPTTEITQSSATKDSKVSSTPQSNQIAPTPDISNKTSPSNSGTDQPGLSPNSSKVSIVPTVAPTNPKSINGLVTKQVIPAISEPKAAVPQSDTPANLAEQTRKFSNDTALKFTTGRTSVWEEAWTLFKKSPVLGYGFHADRLLLNTHLHNSIVHAFFQTGLLGGMAFASALTISWIFMFKLVRRVVSNPYHDKHIVIQIAGILTFLTARSLPESTGAFFGVDWLLLALLMLYLQIMTRAKDTDLATDNSGSSPYSHEKLREAPQ